MNSRRSVRRVGREAFSLVEVVVASAIVAFGFIGMLGMLMVALTGFRNAEDVSVTALIMQYVSTDMQQTDFSTLTNSSPSWYYFDDQGNQLSSSSGGVYWTRVTVFPSASLPISTSLGQANSQLARVEVQIVHNPSGAALTTSTTDGTVVSGQGMSIITRTLFIADNTPAD